MAHGIFNVISGLWPLLHLRSFEAVLGPKRERWLVHTVAGLLIAIGWTQVRSAGEATGAQPARRLGVGSAVTLLVIDVVNVRAGRISRIYLVDAAIEAGWLGAWLLGRRRPARTIRRRR